VSHMGEVEIRGPGAVAWCDRLTVNAVTRLGDGEGQYSILCDEAGGVIDDLIVYRLSADRVLLVVNASNIPSDLAWMRAYASRDAEIVDRSSQTGLLALQGPRAAGVLRGLASGATDMRPFTVREDVVTGHPVSIARTGYTGEDGFELYHNIRQSVKLWDILMAAGNVTPAGLGARDTLRLEMGMALYGNDIDDTVTPLEANLAWLVKLKKGEFVGSPVLNEQKANGVKKKLVGFTMADKNIARHGYPVFVGSEASGVVCSGTMSPTLGIPIGTCYVPTESSKQGSTLDIAIRGKRAQATVVKPPFYKDASHL